MSSGSSKANRQRDDVEEEPGSKRPVRLSSLKAGVRKGLEAIVEGGYAGNTDEAYRLLSGAQPVAASAFDPEAEISEPSKLTNAKEWLPFQYLGQQPRWKCYRGPPTAQPQLPLALLHDSFEEFAKNLEEQEHGDGNANRSPSDVARGARLGRLGLDEDDMKVAYKIWDVLSSGAWDKGVLSEDKGVTRPLNISLRGYLKHSIDRAPADLQTDGFISYHELDAMVGIEDKREPADALLQILEFFRRAWRCNAENYGRRISHGIAMLRVLPTIQFVAVVMDWKSKDPTDAAGVVMAEPLTDPICCYGPTDLGIFKVARAMKALKTFVHGYHPESYIDCSVPYLLRDWSSVKSLSKTLNQGSMVFCGNDEYGSLRVAKFCSSYSEDAHTAWSQAGLAPKLHKVIRMASGWFFIVMDCLTSTDGWKSSMEQAKSYKKRKGGLEALQSSIMEALDRGHSTGYVHGDARLPNIFVRDTRESFEVQFVDFGWAGVEGSDVYPEVVNPTIKWHEDVRFGAPLKRVHDITLICNEIGEYK